MSKKHLYVIFIFILVFSFGCNDDNNSNDMAQPEDFDLTTSECPAEDIREYPNFNNGLEWLCTSLEDGSELFAGSLSTLSGVTSCFSLLSKGDNWCLITPTGQTIFTATHQTYADPVNPPPADENGCRIGEDVTNEEFVCEIVKSNN